MDEQLYVDASAVVKLFVPEPGAPEFAAAAAAAARMASSRITFVEVARALRRRAATDDEHEAMLNHWSTAWQEHDVVDFDQPLAEHAASLAGYHGLRSLDAIHLASALVLPPAPLRFATWDRRLWEAARAVGLRTVPAVCP